MPVHVDHSRANRRAPQRQLQKMLRGHVVPLRGQHEINRVPLRIKGSIQVHFHVRDRGRSRRGLGARCAGDRGGALFRAAGLLTIQWAEMFESPEDFEKRPVCYQAHLAADDLIVTRDLSKVE